MRPAREKTLVLLLSVVLCLLVLEGLLRLVGGATLARMEWLNSAATQSGAAVRVACIGESTTLLGGEAAYPRQLKEVLTERHPGAPWTVLNLGMAGADSSLIMEALPEQLDRYRPHVVVAMMGANDVVSSVVGGREGAYVRAIPDQGVPLAERRGPGTYLKTWRLGELLWFHLTGPPRRMRPPDSLDEGGEPRPGGEHADPRPQGPQPDGGPAHSQPAVVAFDEDVLNFMGLDVAGRAAPVREAWRVWEAGDRHRAQALFREAMEEAGDDPRLSLEFALFLEQFRDGEAEALALLAGVQDPGWAGLARFLEGRLYARLRRCHEAAPLLHGAAIADPALGFGLATLGVCMQRIGLQEEARDVLLQAAGYRVGIRFISAGRLGLTEAPKLPYRERSLPDRVSGLYNVNWPGADADLQRHLSPLEELLQPVPGDPEGYLHRLEFLQARGRGHHIFGLLDEVLSQEQPSPVVLRGMARHLAGSERAGAPSEKEAGVFSAVARHMTELGDDDLAAALTARLGAHESIPYTDMTRDNYRRLQARLAERGIPLVVVQYPTLRLEPLLNHVEWGPDVVFVENRTNFQEAIEQNGFHEVFKDNCYGSFGHGAALGNRILAESVAEGVLKAVEPAELWF